MFPVLRSLNSNNKVIPLLKLQGVGRYGGMELRLPVFLTWTTDEGERLTSRFGRFTPGEKVLGVHWLGGWVDQNESEGGGEERTVCLSKESNSCSRFDCESVLVIH
jgi:hypothetical protein